MKKLLVFTCVLLILAGTAFAQEESDPGERPVVKRASPFDSGTLLLSADLLLAYNVKQDGSNSSTFVITNRMNLFPFTLQYFFFKGFALGASVLFERADKNGGSYTYEDTTWIAGPAASYFLPIWKRVQPFVQGIYLVGQEKYKDNTGSTSTTKLNEFRGSAGINIMVSKNIAFFVRGDYGQWKSRELGEDWSKMEVFGGTIGVQAFIY
jgi:hypothetical protein